MLSALATDLVFTIVYSVELDVAIVMSPDSKTSLLSPSDVIIKYSLVVLY